MICPNGCTDHDTDTPIEMGFGFTRDRQPAYICEQCGTTELMRDRGRL